MRKAIIASHGKLAEELIESLKLFGVDQSFESICFPGGTGIEVLEKQVEQMLLKEECEEYMIFVDIFGGSPCNKILETIKKNQSYFSDRKYAIVSGANLPMLLEYSFLNIEDFDILARCVQEKSVESIKLFSNLSEREV